MKKISGILAFLLIYIITSNFSAYADDGYRLWLKYDLISNAHVLQEYRESIKEWIVEGNSATMKAAEHELKMGLDGLLGLTIPEVNHPDKNGVLIAGTYKNSSLLNNLPTGQAGIDLGSKLKKVGSEGFVIVTGKINGKNAIIITGNTDVGILYGVFTFLRMLQTNSDIKKSRYYFLAQN